MARLEPRFVPPTELTESDIAAIVAVGQEQAALMDDLQAALEACDDLKALGIARQLVGLEQKAREQ